ncbi:MAG: shikimate kinase [Gemmatimonadales bacterium]
MRKHILLVGLPGSGKTTVGRIVAEELQAALMDIDAILLRKEGRPIAAIFAEQGEAAFRTLERREVDAALSQEPGVIVPGGGWAAQAGNLEAARERGFVVYLKTRPETAAGRASPEGTRPVLMGEDPVALMRALLREREPFYARADARVETDRLLARGVALDVVRLARTSAGW